MIFLIIVSAIVYLFLGGISSGMMWNKHLDFKVIVTWFLWPVVWIFLGFIAVMQIPYSLGERIMIWINEKTN